MKIILEHAQLPEPEIIIRGEIGSAEVAAIVQLLGKKPNGKLMVTKQEEQVVLDPSEILFLETMDGQIRVCTQSDTYETKMKLYELIAILPETFTQISKSTVVNMNYVRSIQAEFSGNYRLKLKNCSRALTISRKYFKTFKDKI